MQEYIYYTQDPLGFPLHESITVTDDASSLEAVVCNCDAVTSEVVAPHIDFYIKNTQDSIAAKIQNIKKLYDVALLKYDNAKDLPYRQEVGKKVLIVGSDEEFVKTAKALQNDSFETYHVDASWVHSIDGHIGNLQVAIDNEGKKSALIVDQIIWFDAVQEGLKQSGTFDPNDLGLDAVVQTVCNNAKEYIYKKYLSYDKNICQYHERRDEVCTKCEEVCPSVAITKDDHNKHLIFSHIDCHGCGGCVSVCPSGALDYTPSDRDSLQEISLFYKDTHALIIPQKMDLDFDIALKEGVLPLMIDGEKFLHESTLLTLLQQSGSQIIFYSDFLSKGVKDSINILNAIYQKRYGCDAIIVAMDENELAQAVETVQMISESYFEYKGNNEYKRATFAKRLQALVGDKELGVVATGEHIHYGE
ncbi:MAG: 4Fe-4S dicluster domain-containing protein, partial [Campylobacterota bacterium]